MAYRLPYRLKITVISFHEAYYFLYAAKFIIKNLKKRGALLKKRKALNFQVQTDFFMILLTQCNKQMPLPNPWHLSYQLLMSVARKLALQRQLGEVGRHKRGFTALKFNFKVSPLQSGWRQFQRKKKWSHFDQKR